MDASNEQIANTWIRYTYLPSAEKPETNPLFWVVEDFARLVHDDPERAWKIIEIIPKIDGSEIILANLAAGPLENLLRYHGEKFIDRVEEATVSDPVFKKMLGVVWKSTIFDHIWERVKAVASPSF